MSSITQSSYPRSKSLHERRGEVVQIGALMPALLERYELRFASPHAVETSGVDPVSSDETTSNPSADGLPCV